MCSQRLTRPGKLCRECERELQRAQAVAASVDDLSSAIPVIDAAGMATADSLDWPGRMRSRPPVVAIALSAGFAIAVGLYVIRGPNTAAPIDSVMVDRDLSSVRPRDLRAPAPRPATAVSGVPAAQSAAAISVSAAHVAKTSAPAASARTAASTSAAAGDAGRALVDATADRGRNAADGADAARKSTADAARGPAGAGERKAAPELVATAGHDRVLTLAAALDGCAEESFLARIACEHRARARYCEGAEGRLPECAAPLPREHGN
jgi:hypothetical protein